jgi:DNA-binding transcriptional ArsR family regulator
MRVASGFKFEGSIPNQRSPSQSPGGPARFQPTSGAWNSERFLYYTVSCNSVIMVTPSCAHPVASLTVKPPIEERPLLAGGHASAVVALFKVLANESRLRILHALTRSGELCVGDIAESVGMRTQAVSNQLRRLVDQRIVATRRAGNYIRYRLIDPCVPGLLGLGWCLAEETGRLSPVATSKAKAQPSRLRRQHKR